MRSEAVKSKSDCLARLQAAGISWDDACALRRISMTLHRWHELECGDGNGHASWCITRGNKTRVDGKTVFIHAEESGRPYLERHPHRGEISYTLIPDRERGALKRLAKIMARYPGFVPYVQGDPRGCALYIVRKDDWKQGEDLAAIYGRGIAVHK